MKKYLVEKREVTVTVKKFDGVRRYRPLSDKMRLIKLSVLVLFVILGGLALSNRSSDAQDRGAKSDGPANQGMRVARQDGNAGSGQNVFRLETFGNEGFWTDAARVPQGVVAAGVTPVQALQLGLSVNVDALDAATKKAVAAELKADPTARSSALLNDPQTTVKLVNANAVIGLVVKDTNRDGRLDVGAGDKLGISCALCHAITDGSVLNLPTGGSIGREVDGPTNHNLNVGAILATAANSRAFYPVLQLSLTANKGKTFGRAPKGLTENSSEAEVDAYLSNPEYYPIGMFDDSPDGNGDPMHITPFFRQDLAAPFGSGGEIARLDNFNNLVYTALFDPTNLTTTGGRAFLHTLGGAAGDEIADDYVKVLKATNVTGYPFVQTSQQGQPGAEETPLGVRVDETKLRDLNAYLVKLPAPRGAVGDKKMIDRGRDLFRTVGCTTCHNAKQDKPVPAVVVPMNRIFPGDSPVTLAPRMLPLNPIMDTPGNTFDDKMAVVNASLRGEVRGTALPLLLDLARKPVFLHDDSVGSLDELLNPSRGQTAPHPFYLSDSQERANMVMFLRSLDTR